ncbi:peroxiredoxin [Pseudomonas endophytica]|uniref:Peroxiredoxin n=1 Tax=Pseudomonas endophytica TaxID=1563157 RepID=A0A0Q1CJD4_9PSED|nr:TlpA disulfide reductase family protein [Pseudomonas endophytica]KQB54952.1 peroxiredoxin [Pseudomonas endophytica]
MLKRLLAAAGVAATLLLAGCGNDYGVDQHAEKVASERLDKHWKVVNYWAEWCGPCRVEIPELNALETQLQAQSVELFGVNYDGLQGKELSDASNAMGITFTVLAQDPADIFDLPRSEALPVTYIIDDNGKVRAQMLGEQTAEGILAKLKDLKG